MSHATELNNIIESLKQGKAEEGKRAAQELLKRLSPRELAAAEETLARAGIRPADLRPLCAVHMNIESGRVDQLKQSLRPGHVIHTMICEHEKILEFLNALEKTNGQIQEAKSWSEISEKLSMLKNISHHLSAAEKHHQREEQVLFKALIERGVDGPPQVMTEEHVELRAYKQRLEHLAQRDSSTALDDFKRELHLVCSFLVGALRDHIFKENNILYPMALSVLEGPAQWDQLKRECDVIGYCCFTPQS